MDRDRCTELDADDPLADRRARFRLPGERIYLDGNSLGAFQDAVLEAVLGAAGTWRRDAIAGWNAGWVELPSAAAGRLAPLIGAHLSEVAVVDSTSANLFKAVVAGLALRPQRRRIVVAEEEFPTDRYVVSGIAELTAAEIAVAPRASVEDALDPHTAVVLLSHVDYRTGDRLELEEVTARVHAAGAVIVWDLSHSVGALALDLPRADVDLAVGCSYKFLNGGPGAPAWIYASRTHHDELATALRGWFGHAEPFEFAPDYVPAPGAQRFHNGTPPILSLAALHGALEVFESLDLRALEAKTASLTDVFIRLVDQRCPDVEVVTPRDPARRGAQVSLRHEHAHALIRALAARGVIGDHRPPDLLRFGFAPLYVRHVDVYNAVEVLADLLETDAWDRPEFHARERVP